MIKLKADCGAVDGQPADAAWRIAIDKTYNEANATIFLDGKFRITEQTYANFSGRKGKHLIILGEGANSQILPDTAPNVQALVFANAESVVFRDFVFAGNPEKQWDCGLFLNLGYVNQVVWDNVHMYGLSSPELNTNGLVYMDACGFMMRNSQVRGCTSVGSGFFTLRQFRKVGFSNVEFMDYGELDYGGPSQYRSKTSQGFSKSWIKFQDAIGEAYPGTPMLEQMTLDEGARYGVECAGNANWMHGLRLRDVSFNVRHGGLLLNKVNNLVIEDGLFTYRGGVPAIVGTNVKRTRLTRCIADKEDIGITLSGEVNKLTLDECQGFEEANISYPEGTDFDTTN